MEKFFSDFLKVNFRDLVKSILMAFLGSAVTALYTIVNDGGTLPTPEQWKTIVIMGVTSALAYLVKNFFTNSEDKFMKKDA
jgi:hypothetical protein